MNYLFIFHRNKTSFINDITVFTYNDDGTKCDGHGVTEEVSKSLSEDRKDGIIFQISRR